MVKMTKKNEGLLHGYKWAMSYYGQRGLWDCYSKPSFAKVQAYNRCLCDRMDLRGYEATVVGYNCTMFSYAFKYDLTDELTGEVCTHLRYYTKDNTYDFRIA